MKRLLVLVEGQTEETFVNNVLAPHLASFQVWPAATCICTKRVQGRRAFRGGIGSYGKVKNDLQLLLNSAPHAVTTLFDYYGLPSDFPGSSAPGSATARVGQIEEAFGADIADPRFIPYLMLHEFEAMLFTEPRVIGSVLLDDTAGAVLETIAARRTSPEEINDGNETHPSRQITNYLPGYQKPLHGPQIAARIGIDAIRGKCPHFSQWLARLEAL